MDPLKQSVINMPPPPPPPMPQPVLVAQPARRVNSGIVKMILAMIIFALMLIFNIVLLGGVAASQAKCKDLDNPWWGFPTNLVDVPSLFSQGSTSTSFVKQQLALAGVATKDNVNQLSVVQSVSVSEQCRNEYSFDWWIVFFQLTCLILAVVTAFIPSLHARFRTGILVWFGMVAALLMYLTSVYNRYVWLLTMAIDFMDPSVSSNNGDNKVDGLKLMMLDAIQGTTKDYRTANQTAMAGAIVCIVLDMLCILWAADTDLAPAIHFGRRNTGGGQPQQTYMQEMSPASISYPTAAPMQSQELSPGAYTGGNYPSGANYPTGGMQQAYGGMQQQQQYGGLQHQPSYNNAPQPAMYAQNNGPM